MMQTVPARLPGQNSGTRAITEQESRPMVLRIRDAREQLGGDHDHIFGGPPTNKRSAHFQRVKPTRTRRIQVKGEGSRNP